MAIRSIVPMRLRYMLMELRGRSLYSGFPDRHRCIFIHIPKTAGTSVVHALFGTGSRHVPCVEYEKANPRKFATYFKFAFVRNPWDRLYSAYHFLARGGMGDYDRVWADAHLAEYVNFEVFVREGLRKEAVLKWVHFRPQHEFISDSRGLVAMDFLGRMERIESDFESVRRRLRIDATLPILNRVEKVDYTRAYNAEMVDVVSRVYERDIELFGYAFGEGR